MVVPKRHTKNLAKLNKNEVLDLFKTLREVTNLLNRILKPQGYNIGINIGRVSGAGVPNHLHLHVVPRWAGDTNFMPVIANTKVISQSLSSLYNELCKETKKISKRNITKANQYK